MYKLHNKVNPVAATAHVAPDFGCEGEPDRRDVRVAAEPVGGLVQANADDGLTVTNEVI